MKLLFNAALILLVIFFQDWIVQPIDNKVSVSFPFKPTKELLGGEPYYNAASTDGFTCTAMATDYSKGAPDSTTLAAYMKTHEALKSMEESLVRDFVGGKILNSKTTTYAGHVAMDITMTTGKKASDGQFDMMSYRAIVVGIKFYSLYFYYDQHKQLPAIQDKFFSSFSIK